MTLELVLSTSVHINSFNLELGTCLMERKEIHRDTDDKWMFCNSQYATETVPIFLAM